MWRRVLPWLVPLGLALVLNWHLASRRIDLLAPNLNRFTYVDAPSGGSSIAWSEPGLPWRLGMALRPGFAFPYAAACIRVCPSSQGCDLSGYDSLVFEGRSRRQNSLRLLVGAFEPGFTDTSIGGTYAQLEGAFPIERNSTRQAVSLRDLPVPLWWDDVNGSRPRAHPGLREHLTTVCFLNGMGTAIGIDDTVEVQRLELRAHHSWGVGVGLAALALFLSACAEWLLRRRGRTTPSLVEVSTSPTILNPDAPGKDVDLGNRSEEDAQRLLAWLSEHYMQEDLAVEQVAREVGIHYRRIPRLLKDACGRTFPGQVNHLRIGQAKRLLREIDRSVSEIATSVGIANISHFHRLFKAELGMTPLEWRAKQGDSSTSQR